MDTCTSKSYTASYAGVSYTVKPTSGECQNGEINRCLVDAGILGCAYRYTKDLGAGIGPKPTTGSTRSYDIGAVVDYQAKLALGIEGSFYLDGGSVDVTIAGQVIIEANKESAQSGELVSISSSFKPGQGYSLQSRYPGAGFSFGSFVDARFLVKADYAMPDYEDGSQLRQSATLLDESSVNSSLLGLDETDDFIADINLNNLSFHPAPLAPLSSPENENEFALHGGEWLGADINTDGIQIRILEQELGLFGNGFSVASSVRVPLIPRNLVTGVGFEVAEAALLAPKLSTPVEAYSSFDCGDNCQPSNQVVDGVNGSISNSSPLGQRKLSSGLASDGQFNSLFVADGMFDNDFFRVDLDLDFLTLALSTPLGVNVDGPKLRGRAGKLGPVIAAEGNLADFDAALFLSVSQDLRFEPHLMVDYEFDQSVEVSVNGAAFELVDSLTLPAGQSFEFKQPAHHLSITPRYSLREHRFYNDTRIWATPVFQSTLLQLKLGGLIFDYGTFLPNNIALFQSSLELSQPLELWPNQPAIPFSLAGFSDLQGTPISVMNAASDSDNDGINDIDDQCANSEQGSAVGADGCPVTESKKAKKKGGGATGLFVLLMLLLSLRKAWP